MVVAAGDSGKTFFDVCSHRVQATLGVLYAQPPLTQDANMATDGTMMVGVGEPVPEVKKVEESIEGLPSPGDSANASVDVSRNDANVTTSMEARGVDGAAGGTLSTPPPVPVSIDDHQQQQGKTGDLPDITDVAEVRQLVPRYWGPADLVQSVRCGDRPGAQ